MRLPLTTKNWWATSSLRRSLRLALDAAALYCAMPTTLLAKPVPRMALLLAVRDVRRKPALDEAEPTEINSIRR
jgi:hypothetical protein